MTVRKSGRMVSINGRGYTYADISKALEFWSKEADSNHKQDADCPPARDCPRVARLCLLLRAEECARSWAVTEKGDNAVSKALRAGVKSIVKDPALEGEIIQGVYGFTLNPDYDLGTYGSGVYVIHHDGGYSCNGYRYVHEQTGRLADWLHAKGGGPIALDGVTPIGTPAAYALYRRVSDLCATWCNSRGIQCDIDLTPQLIGLEGHRVEVENVDGHTRRFRVGKSLGWCPIHLEIEAGDTGGPGAMGAPYKAVRDLGKVR